MDLNSVVNGQPKSRSSKRSHDLSRALRFSRRRHSWMTGEVQSDRIAKNLG